MHDRRTTLTLNDTWGEHAPDVRRALSGEPRARPLHLVERNSFVRVASLAPAPNPPASPLAVDTLAATASCLADAAVWKTLTPLTDTERWYALVAASDWFEAWVIGWPVGGAIELHDHGGSSGAVHVVRGALEETSTNRVSRTPLALARVGEGEGFVFGPDHVHDVVNPGSPARPEHPRLRSAADVDDVLRRPTGALSRRDPARDAGWRARSRRESGPMTIERSGSPVP